MPQEENVVRVRLNEVVEALESAMEEHAHYLDKRTGEIILLTSEDLTAAEDDAFISEYPDWQRESILKAREVLHDSEPFIELPDQFYVHEYKIMEDFCLAFEDREVGDELRRLIKGGGAFRRFKNAIHEKGVDHAWYEFKRSALEKIATEWLEENDIHYWRDDPTDVSEVSM
jgi:hypothetical protein